MSTLRALSRQGLTVVASATEPPHDADTVIPLTSTPAEPPPEPVPPPLPNGTPAEIAVVTPEDAPEMAVAATEAAAEVAVVETDKESS